MLVIHFMKAIEDRGRCHKDRQLVILVESGSTTSFLHTRVAMELKLDVVKLPLSAVTV